MLGTEAGSYSPFVSTSTFNTLDELDRLSGHDTQLHRLDARVKLLVTASYVVAVISFGKYEIAGLAPFLLFPVLLAAWGNLPISTLIRRSFLALPVAVALAIFNPWLDPQPMVIGPNFVLPAGWFSLTSIGLKAVLTAFAAVLLVASTTFSGVCAGLRRLGVPQVFTQQLLFLWRYAGVLADEANHLLQARNQRSFSRPLRPRVAARLIGALLQRTLERAERIHAAMLCRGFRGHLPQSQVTPLRLGDIVFLLVAFTTILACRLLPITKLLGSSLLRGIG